MSSARTPAISSGRADRSADAGPRSGPYLGVSRNELRENVRMPRILGVDIPNDKRTVISLCYIYGIGPYLADQLCQRTGIDPESAGPRFDRRRPGQAGLVAGQRVHGRRSASSPSAAEHRPAARHRLLSGFAAPQGTSRSAASEPGPTREPARVHARRSPARRASRNCGDRSLVICQLSFVMSTECVLEGSARSLRRLLRLMTSLF